MNTLTINLIDADLASRSPLATQARAATLVPAPTVVELRVDPHRLRVQLLGEFRAAWSAGDHDRMSVVMAAAADLDDEHPDEVPLRDELLGTQYMAVA